MKVYLQTIIISIIFFIIVYVITNLGFVIPISGDNKIESIHVFIALVPFIVLLIASGKLKEIKGPGGISLLLKDEAERNISFPIDDNTLEVEPQIVQTKGGLHLLNNIENPPAALSFVVGEKNYYTQYAIEEYLRELNQVAEFRHVIFVSGKGELLGYMKAVNFSAIIKSDNIVEKIENELILIHRNTCRESVKINSSNKDTLAEMEKYNVNELAVVDYSGKYVGMISQDQIERKILSKIIREV